MKSTDPKTFTLNLDDRGGLAALGIGLGCSALFLAMSQLGKPLLVFLVPVAAATGYAIFVRRQYALLLLVFATYADLPRVLSKVHGVPFSNVFLLWFVIAAVAWGWLRQGHRAMPKAQVVWPLTLYFAVCLLSLTAAQFPGASFDRLVDYAKALAIGIAASLALDDRRNLRGVAWALVAATLLMSSVTALQFLTESFTNGYLGLGQVEVHWLGGKEQFRSSGPTADPNFYGLILVGGIPIAMTLFLVSKNLAAKVLTAACLSSALVSLFFTSSRGALFGLVASFLFLALRFRPSTRVVATVSLLSFLLLPLLPPSYWARLAAIPTTVFEVAQGNSGTESSTQGRISEALVALEMFKRHPIRGVGVGNYPPLYQDYQVDLGLDRRITEREPHSLYLEAAAETGLLGLLSLGLICLQLAVFIPAASRRLSEAGLTADADLVWGFGASLVGVLACSVLLHAAKPNHLWLLLAFGLAIGSLSEEPGLGES